MEWTLGLCRTPHAKHLKQRVTIRLGVNVITYSKELAEETGIPYQNLINLYLRDCVASGRKPSLGNSAYRWAMAKGHVAARVNCAQFGRLRGRISCFGSREVGCR